MEDKFESFIEYHKKHPEERFWQALKNWSGKKFILTADSVDYYDDEIIYNDIRDTFYDR